MPAGAAVAAPAAPLLIVRITPGYMDESLKKGELKVKVILPSSDTVERASLYNDVTSDLQTPLSEVIVTDAQGVVPRSAGEGKAWVAARPMIGDVSISYVMTVSNTPQNGGTTPVFPRIDDQGFSATGMTFLAVPELATPHRILIDWDLDAMGPGATAVSSAGDGRVELPAGPVSRLQDVAFMAGKLHREPGSGAVNKFSAAWSGDAGFDLHPPMQWAAKLHDYMQRFFQTPNDPAYRVFIRNNGGRNPGGGVAFPNSFFATYGPGVTGESMKQILGHEMTHTFTANELGKWYVEGDAVFYQVQLPWRAGMASIDDYLNDINLTAARYYTNAEIDAPEDKIAPNFFKDPWLNTLAYDRGAVYFAALNGKIRRASGGRRSVDDLVRVMVHRQRTGQEITEETWVDLLRKEIGEDGVALHRAMMAGGIVTPQSDDFGPCFRRVSAKVRRYELGFKAKTSDGATTVTDLVAGSEAAKAGLRNGDVVVLPPITTDGVKRLPTATLTARVVRGGRSFTVTYLPRGAAFDAYQWERIAGISDAACKTWGQTPS